MKKIGLFPVLTGLKNKGPDSNCQDLFILLFTGTSTQDSGSIHQFLEDQFHSEELANIHFYQL